MARQNNISQTLLSIIADDRRAYCDLLDRLDLYTSFTFTCEPKACLLFESEHRLQVTISTLLIEYGAIDHGLEYAYLLTWRIGGQYRYRIRSAAYFPLSLFS